VLLVFYVSVSHWDAFVCKNNDLFQATFYVYMIGTIGFVNMFKLLLARLIFFKRTCYYGQL